MTRNSNLKSVFDEKKEKISMTTIRERCIILYFYFWSNKYFTTLGAETFASRNFRERKNINFRVWNFREWTEKLNFFVVWRKRLDPDRNKREKKTLLFQAFVVLGLVLEHQTFFWHSNSNRSWPRFRITLTSALFTPRDQN